MAVVFTRVDNRLIHGQVATNWLKSYEHNTTIVVDDEVSVSDLQKNILQMAAGADESVKFLSVDDAIKKLPNADPRRRMFLVFRDPISVLRAVKGGVKIDHVNIGNMHMDEGKEKLLKTVYASAEEKEAIKELINLGVTVEQRLLPADSSVDFKKILF